jgi:hypothetical protein
VITSFLKKKLEIKNMSTYLIKGNEKVIAQAVLKDIAALGYKWR